MECLPHYLGCAQLTEMGMTAAVSGGSQGDNHSSPRGIQPPGCIKPPFSSLSSGDGLASEVSSTMFNGKSPLLLFFLFPVGNAVVFCLASCPRKVTRPSEGARLAAQRPDPCSFPRESQAL